MPGSGARTGIVMSAPAECRHPYANISIERNGSRLHPSVWLVERCLDCNKELDRKKAPRGSDVYSKRVDKS